MFCQKCGNNIPDGTRFCASCGTPVEINVTETAPSGDTKIRKGKAGLIIGLLVAIFLITGVATGTFLFFNQPMRKINKAIEASDTITVVELYGKLSKEEDQKLVKKEMLRIADEIYDDFVSDELSYDEVRDQLKPLGKEILKGNNDYDEIISNIDTINDSRDNFAKAEDAFKAENYEDAYNYYLMVNDLDHKNFSKAQKQIEACLELMIVPIEGIWKCTIDAGDALAEEMGISGYGYSVVFNLPILLTLNEDGSGQIEFDMDDIRDSVDDFFESLNDIMYLYFEETEGLSRDEVDLYLSISGYASISDLFSEFMDEDDLLSEFESDKTYFNYTYENGKFNIDGGTEVFDVDVTEDSLTIKGGDDSADTFGLEELGIDNNSLTFTRVG